MMANKGCGQAMWTTDELLRVGTPSFAVQGHATQEVGPRWV